MNRVANRNPPLFGLGSNSIFASFEHEEFRSKLEALASVLGCNLYWSKDPPDLIATASFVKILDRTVVGSDAWKMYEQFRDEVKRPPDESWPLDLRELIEKDMEEGGDCELCFLIDDGPPSPHAVAQLKIESPEVQDHLLDFIRDLHALGAAGMCG